MRIRFSINTSNPSDFQRPGRRATAEAIATRLALQVVGRETEILNSDPESFVIKFLDESYLYFGFSGDDPVVIYTPPAARQ